MHVTFVSTYLPTACGLATFTQNLYKAVAEHPGATGAVVAIRNGKTPSCPPMEEVLFEVRRSVARDYTAAAEFINFTGTDVVSLQHEFGIFGGEEGSYIVPFLKKLQKPVITTLHTVLAEPTAPYRRALLAVAEHSDRLVVMSEKARAILCDVYSLSAARIHVIPHGVPDLPFESPAPYKKQLGDLEGRTVVMTFGLLGPAKGIELVLEALPEVVRAYPDTLYVVLGATHPEVKRQDGEAYRHQLLRQVQQLGLEEHVRFIDRYVSKEELHDYLRACDIYVTPYPGREQISSGTLAYAVGAGRAVVSTPYFYAEELLGEGRGWLVDFGDVEEMRRALCTLIGHPEQREALRRVAYAFGRQMTWPRVGEAYIDLFARSRRRQERSPRRRERAPQQRIALAHITLDHLAALTDDTGIFQHASYGVPERGHGYCTDDAARALVVALAYHVRHSDQLSSDLVRTYLSFLQHAQRGDGHFHNFMSYARVFADEQGSEDTLGRALWGLGATVAWGPTVEMRVLARQMFERAMHRTLTHPRSRAYALCGLDLFLRRYPGATEVRRRVRALADGLVRQYEEARCDDWHWFHDALTYANAKLPQAMLLAYEATGEEQYKRIGLESLSFLIEKTYRDDQFEFVGNGGWYRRGATRADFGQQAIEAGYTAEACMAAYRITGAPRYYTLAQAAAEWFFGRNGLGQQLYDPATGACLDGLEAWGPNLNQGAESTIACLLGLLAVTEGLSALPPGRRVSDSRVFTSSLP